MSAGSTNGRKYVFICLNEDCCKRGSESIREDLKARCAEMQDVEIREYICFGNCDYGANTIVFPDRVWFSGLRRDGASVVLEYLQRGILSPTHTGKVEVELADTTWELLELEIEDEEDLLPVETRAVARPS